MARHVALLRGINVGTAKQVPMLDLQQVFVNLGASGVRTVLRSGNVVFDAVGAPSAASVEAELVRVAGVQSSVIVLAADTFAEIVEADPLVDAATDGSRHFVTFLSHPIGRIEVPDAAELSPELLSVGDRAVYQWFPDGSLQTRVPAAFWKQFGGAFTARNWNTVTRLLALTSAPN